MVLNTSEIGVLKKSKWKDFVAEAGWKWPLKTGSSECVWGEGDISMGCWGKSEKTVDPGEAGCDLCGRGGRHWTVGGWWGAGLTEAKGTGRNEAVGVGRQDGVPRPQHQMEGSESQVLGVFSGDAPHPPLPRGITGMNLSDTVYIRPKGWCKHRCRQLQQLGKAQLDSKPLCLSARCQAGGPADLGLRMFSGGLGSLQLLSQAAVVCGL